MSNELFRCPFCNHRYLTLEPGSHVCKGQMGYPVVQNIKADEALRLAKWENLTEEQRRNIAKIMEGTK